MSMKGPIAIGIDLGTTNSCVAAYRNGKVEVIANAQGNRTTPSWVLFTDKEKVVGEPAKFQSVKNPANAVFGVKRLIGKQYNDALQERIKLWPFEVINEGGKPKIKVKVKGQDETYYPEEISTMVLAAMKKTAEDLLEMTVHKAVVAVPAHFDDYQRERTQEACRQAGLEPIAIINEPTAAALAYAYGKEKDTKTRTVLVYDVGGGTLDVSILSVTGSTYEVMATAGNDHLAGEDFDENLFNYLADEFKKEHGEDITVKTPAGIKAVAKLRRACEEAKRHLSHTEEAEIDQECLFGGEDLIRTISREKFEKINEQPFKETINYVQQAMTDSGIQVSDIDDVVLVGGSTRIPKLQSLLAGFFKGKELKKGINPDEAVAYGAAIRAASLTDNFKDVNMLLLEVTPHSIGIETCSGVMEVMVKKNSRLPAKCSTNFTTVYPNQESILFEIYQGERAIAKDNVFLGSIKVSGIRRSPPGVPTIVVNFEFNKDGRLVIKAHEKKFPENLKTVTFNRHQQTIKKDRLEKNLTESGMNKLNDEEEKKRVLAMNRLQTECLKMKYFFDSSEMMTIVTGPDRTKVIQGITEALLWMNQNKMNGTKDEFENQQIKVEELCRDLVNANRSTMAKMFEQE